jgi:hypothetical protein
VDLWPYFTIPDSRLPFSPPPTSRRATVEEFHPASTREDWGLNQESGLPQLSSLQPLCTDRVENIFSKSNSVIACVFVVPGTCLPIRYLETAVVFSPISQSLHTNGCTRYDINLVCRLLLLISCLSSYFVFKMKALCSSETSGCIHTTWRYSAESCALRP